jgi:hypothetical protein
MLPGDEVSSVAGQRVRAFCSRKFPGNDDTAERGTTAFDA